MVIDLLGWPVIALLYPLFASVRAVETDSRNHMRKLAMYWTIFSLFSLFEFAFAKVIEWMPFWSGIRLVLSFCLVMPHFEGSCLAYQGFVCLVVDRFGLLKEERLCKRDTFLDVVEKYIKENGSEALEKFIASEMTSPEARVENRRPKTPPLKKTQQEWTCDLCKITTMGESSLNAHLQGSMHKSKIEFLKASLLDPKDTGPLPSPKMQHRRPTSAAWDLKGPYAAAEVHGRMPPKQPESPVIEKTQQEWTHLQGSKHKSNLESSKASLIDAKDTAPSPLVQRSQSVSTAWVPKGTYEASQMTSPEVGVGNRHAETPPSRKLSKNGPVIYVRSLPWQKVQHRRPTSAAWVLKGTYVAAEAGQGESSVPYRDVKVVESLAKNGSAASQQHAQSTEVPKRTDAKAEVKEKKTPPEASRPETLPLKKEWSCGLCNVKYACEQNLDAHFLGSKHKSKLKSLKTWKGNQVVYETIDGKHWCMICNAKLLTDVDVASHLKGNRHASNIDEMGVKGNQVVYEARDGKHWCMICNAKLLTDVDVASHLKGKRHASNINEMLKL